MTLPFPIRRDFVAGLVAGMVGVSLFGQSMQLQDTPTVVSSTYWLLLIIAGGLFGIVFGYQSQAAPATLSGGVLMGLTIWILGPLTLVSAAMGHMPTWSISEVSNAFPTLIGHLLYGGLVGLVFHLAAAVYGRFTPAQSPAMPVKPSIDKRIVVLGGGFGGISAAQRLEQLFSTDERVKISLVSHSNYLLFTPMLAEVAASGLEARHISAPVRAALQRTRFYRAEIDSIDTHKRVVHIRSGRLSTLGHLAYDHLVLALGSQPDFRDLPGVEAHAFTLKTLQDAAHLRNHLITMLEQADVEPNEGERRQLLTFVVAGASFSGAEVIAEIFDLVYSVLRYYPNVPPDELRFIVVHSRDRILPEVSANLATYALRKLQDRGIEFRLNTRIAGASANTVTLTDESVIATYTFVWTAGNQPNAILQSLHCDKNRAGAVVCDPMMQVSGLEHVWAVGDCAAIPDVDAPGSFFPPTAQHALREGRGVAENIAAVIHGEALQPFRFRTLGVLVALGYRTGVAEIQGWQFSGFLAWMMWRTLYLSKLPGLEKKVRVLLDWTIDLFFPRDIVLIMDAIAPTISQLTQAKLAEAEQDNAREAT